VTGPFERLRLIWIDVRVMAFRTILRSRFLMELARRFPRFAKLPNHARLVVHHEDAVDALARGRGFGMPYLQKMRDLRAEEPGGVFVLGLDDGPEHARLRAALQVAIDRCDLQALHDDSRRCADELLGTCRRIEVCSELTDPVLAATIGGRLGVAIEPRHLNDGRAVFHDIFINGLRDPRVSRRAGEASAELHRHFTPLIERGRGGDDDILGRLIAGGQMSRVELIDHVIGLFVAWSASVSRAMAFAMHALFKYPDGYELAKRAASAGDRELMNEVIREAFRFMPPAPAVERLCRRETPIRGRAVRREGQIVVALTSAMMDDGVVDEPGRFRIDRPCGEDLSFGSGSHACLGRDLALAQLSGILIELFRRPGPKWAYGLKLEGPYPHRLEVTL
jgi:cytochrome P450